MKQALRSIFVAGVLLAALTGQAADNQPGFLYNNFTMQNLASPVVGAVYTRMGFLAPGDAPPLQYVFGSSPCPSADNGYQVAWTGGGPLGCFQAMPPANGMTITEWGADATGARDTGPILAAAASAIGGKLPIQIPVGSFLVSTAETIGGVPDFEGVPSPVDRLATACPTTASSIVIDSDITPLTLDGPSFVVRNVCFQGATVAGTRASGSLLAAGATASTTQNEGLIQYDSFINGFDGVSIGGPTAPGQQTVADRIHNSLFTGNSNSGIVSGQLSYGSTTGVEIVNIQLICRTAAATGITIYDGPMQYQGADTGPYDCQQGIAFTPSYIGVTTDYQNASGELRGVVGDTSAVGSVVIEPGQYGHATYIHLNNIWAAAASGNTGAPVLISNPNTGGIVQNISIVGGIFHGGDNSQPIIDLEGNVCGVTIVGAMIAADDNGTGDTGILDNSSCAGNVFNSNNFTSQNGTLAAAIDFANTSLGKTVVVGNIFSTATAPIVVNASMPATVPLIQAENSPLKTNFPTVSSATTMLLTPVGNSTYFISGTTAPTLMGPCLGAGSTVTLIPTSGITTTSGGTDSGNTIKFATTIVIAANTAHTFTCSGVSWF